MRGRFISFEGPEGSGKSTHVERLRRALEAAGRKTVVVREPGGTRLAERIRALVREEFEDPPTVRCETLLFLAARAQLVEKTIVPALERGEWVLTDRFSDSTFAYQGYGRGVDLDLLRRLNGFATDGLAPDLTILLDVPPELSAERTARRRHDLNEMADRMEQAGDAFHRRVREGFLELARTDPARFAVVDSSGPPETVAAAIDAAVARLG